MLRKLNAIRSQSRLDRKRTYAHGELDLLLLFLLLLLLFLLLLLLLVRQCRTRVAKCFVEWWVPGLTKICIIKGRKRREK